MMIALGGQFRMQRRARLASSYVLTTFARTSSHLAAQFNQGWTR